MIKLISHLFKRAFAQKNVRDLSELLKLVETYRKPCLRLIEDKTNKNKMGASKIGGLPHVNINFDWPKWKNTEQAFLAQINLEEININDFDLIFPAKGLLYFFYDQEQSIWGFDPKDKGSWKVIYEKNIESLNVCTKPASLKNDAIFKEKFIKPEKFMSYPAWETDEIEKLNFNDSEIDLYLEFIEDEHNHPNHQLFGYPDLIQRPMELECQLVSNGVYLGNPKGYESEEAQKIGKYKDNWKLLLQLDSDDDIGTMWGDCGMLYFWYDTSKKSESVFDDIWMILQCY